MHPDVFAFLESCARTPAAVVPVKLVWRAFNDSLPAGKRGAWSRDRFLAELARAQFAIGELEGRAVVVGVAVPGAGWTVENGLVKAETAA